MVRHVPCRDRRQRLTRLDIEHRHLVGTLIRRVQLAGAGRHGDADRRRPVGLDQITAHGRAECGHAAGLALSDEDDAIAVAGQWSWSPGPMLCARAAPATPTLLVPASSTSQFSDVGEHRKLTQRFADAQPLSSAPRRRICTTRRTSPSSNRSMSRDYRDTCSAARHRRLLDVAAPAPAASFRRTLSEAIWGEAALADGVTAAGHVRRARKLLGIAAIETQPSGRARASTRSTSPTRRWSTRAASDPRRRAEVLRSALALLRGDGRRVPVRAAGPRRGASSTEERGGGAERASMPISRRRTAPISEPAVLVAAHPLREHYVAADGRASIAADGRTRRSIPLPAASAAKAELGIDPPNRNNSNARSPPTIRRSLRQPSRRSTPAAPSERFACRSRPCGADVVMSVPDSSIRRTTALVAVRRARASASNGLGLRSGCSATSSSGKPLAPVMAHEDDAERPQGFWRAG